ncbi:unnamed protein product, partial [Didymodactylos carnosus]
NETLLCFECASTQPGCGEIVRYPTRTITCPKENYVEMCVKIVEISLVEPYKQIIRGCLSSLEVVRFDLPTYRLSGCWTQN